MFRRGVAVAALAALASGCFALFELDGYGPATVDVEMPDSMVLDAPSLDAEVADVAPRPTKIVFVTSEVFAVGQGFSQDIASAHSRCNVVAKRAGIEGEFKAWLSNSDADPASEFAALKNDGGDTNAFVTLSGTLIASSYAELADSGPRVAIDVTETKERAETAPEDVCQQPFVVWTATSSAGTRETSQGNCVDWRATSSSQNGGVGRIAAGPTAWTSACQIPCNQRAHLYCFQQ